jgi:hypothetical protein
MRSFLGLVLAVAACGGGKTTSTPKETGQPIAVALAMVCAAPTRAEADPGWADPSARQQVLESHLSDGVTNATVLATVNGWRDESKSVDERLAELDGLIHEANLTSSCRLQDEWKAPDDLDQPDDTDPPPDM